MYQLKADNTDALNSALRTKIVEFNAQHFDAQRVPLGYKFVDNNNKALSILKQNLSLLSIESDNTIIKSDVIKFISNEQEQYDLILADPPYHKFKLEDFFPALSNNIFNDGILCYETGKHEYIQDLSFKIKKFGNTQLIFWRKNE